MCQSATYNRDKLKTGIGFFKFPKDPATYKAWTSVIKQFHRGGGDDSSKIKPTTVVCEFHVKPEDIRVSIGIGRKTLRLGVADIVNACSKCASYEDEVLWLRERVNNLEKEKDRITTELNDVRAQNIDNEERMKSFESKRIFNYKNISSNPEMFKKFTGFEKGVFDTLFEFLVPGANNENMKFYEQSV